MHLNHDLARALAAAFVAGNFDVDGLVERGGWGAGRKALAVAALPGSSAVCLALAGRRVRPRQTTVANFILADDGFSQACERHDLTLIGIWAAPAIMTPVAAATAWRVPTIRTSGELADWLEISLGELDSCADRRSWRGQTESRPTEELPLPTSGQAIRPGPACGSPQAAAEGGTTTNSEWHSPDGIPVHASVHGFCRGRSIQTFAAPHVGQQVVLGIDLEDFFPWISMARIQAMFRTVGYPEGVADLLAGLCSNSTPADVWDECTTLLPTAGRQMHNLSRSVFASASATRHSRRRRRQANLCGVPDSIAA